MTENAEKKASENRTKHTSDNRSKVEINDKSSNTISNVLTTKTNSIFDHTVIKTLEIKTDSTLEN